MTAHEVIPVQLDGDPGGYVRPHAAASPADGLSGSHAGSDNAPILADPAEWTVEILPSAAEHARPRPPRRPDGAGSARRRRFGLI